MKIPDNFGEKAFPCVWGLWEGSLEETGYKLGLEEWTVLWPTESREEKGPWRKNAMSKRGWHKSTGDDKRTKAVHWGCRGAEQ